MKRSYRSESIIFHLIYNSLNKNHIIYVRTQDITLRIVSLLKKNNVVRTPVEDGKVVKINCYTSEKEVALLQLIPKPIKKYTNLLSETIHGEYGN